LIGTEDHIHFQLILQPSPQRLNINVLIMSSTLGLLIEGVLRMLVNIDFVKILVNKLVAYVYKTMFPPSTRALDLQKKIKDEGIPPLKDLMLLVPGGKGNYKIDPQLFSFNRGYKILSESGNVREKAVWIEQVLKHITTTPASTEETKQAIESLVQHVFQLVISNHMTDPDYIVQKDIQSVPTNKLLKQQTTNAMMLPSPELLHSLSQKNAETISKFNEKRTLAVVRYNLDQQILSMIELVPLVLLLFVVKITPFRLSVNDVFTTDDELLNLDILNQYLIKLPGSSVPFFNFSNSAWLFVYMSLFLLCMWKVFALKRDAEKGTKQVSVSKPSPMAGVFIMQSVDPYWHSYLTITKYKCMIGLMAGVSEEIAYRCVFVLSAMLSVATYETIITFFLATLPTAVVLVLKIALTAGGIVAIHRKFALAAAIGFSLALVLHLGSILELGWVIRDFMDVATFFWFNSLFERTSEHDPIFVLGIIVSSLSFCAGHAYQGQVLTEMVTEETGQAPSANVTWWSLFFAVGTKLFPAIMFAEVMLEQGLAVAIFWHGIHDIVCFMIAQICMNSMIAPESECCRRRIGYDSDGDKYTIMD